MKRGTNTPSQPNIKDHLALNIKGSKKHATNDGDVVDINVLLSSGCRELHP